MLSPLALVLCLAVGSYACYIQSCPFSPANFQKRTRAISAECGKCGPDGTGRCFGASVCCVPGAGCLVGVSGTENTWTTECVRQSHSRRPCAPSNTPCSLTAEHDGFCTVDGHCCNTVGCAASAECMAQKK